VALLKEDDLGDPVLEADRLLRVVLLLDLLDELEGHLGSWMP
jgi:hypothetical protein